MATLNFDLRDSQARASETSLLTPTIFHEPWWLDATTGGRWQEATVRSGGREVGRLPYLAQTKWGMVESVLPVLTPLLGPAIDPGSGRRVQRLHRQRMITLELIEQLPKVSRFHQRMHGAVPDTLPFVESGFSSVAEFTYTVPPAPVDTLWANMRDKTRNSIRRAGEQSRIVDLDPSEFSQLYASNLKRRGKAFNYMWQSGVDPVLQALLERGRGRLIGAVDAHGRMMAGIMVVWDRAATYLILTTRQPDTHHGLVACLTWEAMRESAAHGRTFDFGGVGSLGSILFYSGFGGNPEPRYVVRRTSPVFEVVDYGMRKARNAYGKLLAPALVLRHRDPDVGPTWSGPRPPQGAAEAVDSFSSASPAT